MKRFWMIAAAFGLCVVLSVICILYVDQPVELFVNAHQHHKRIFQVMASPSLLSLPVALVFLCGYALAGPAGAPGPRAQTWLSVSASVLIATALKDELKWIFGRPWPGSWVHEGLYTFKPFTDNMFYGGFPSGHTAYIAAPMFMLCRLVPKYRMAWLGIIGMVMLGLVAAGYHYIADVISGLFVGLAAAAGTAAMMPLKARPGVLPSRRGALDPGKGGAAGGSPLQTFKDV